MSLFAADTEFIVCADSRNPTPTQEVRGGEGLRPVFENLRSYEATTHFNGQSTVTWDQDAAEGILYRLARRGKLIVDWIDGRPLLSGWRGEPLRHRPAAPEQGLRSRTEIGRATG